MRISVLLLLWASLLSCRRATSDGETLADVERRQSAAALAALPACSGLRAPQDEWPRLDLGQFSLQLPSHYVRRTGVEGIDSYMGQFEGAGGSLGIDYGNFSNPLDSLEPDQFQLQFQLQFHATRACRESIGGHVARLVTARGDTFYFAGAAWRDLEQTTLGAMHLTIMVTSKDSIGQAEAIQILRSVRFP